MKKWQKTLIGLGIFIALCSYNLDNSYDTSAVEIVNEDYYATYSGGAVYIGDRCFLDGIDCNEGDILVEDLRYNDDPDMKVINSIDIKDKNKRNEILEILCSYEEDNPSTWNRSIESMRLEWLMHNISYDYGLEKRRTKDVDLDNEDEDEYDNKVLSKIFKL